MKRFNTENHETAIVAACNSLEQIIDLCGELGTALTTAEPADVSPFVVARVMLAATEFSNRIRDFQGALLLPTA